MAEVILLNKERLRPRFGHAVPSKQMAYVREDLPKCVRTFVTFHELYHLRDKAKWWVWREVKAAMYGGLRHPIGLLVCLLMSLAPYGLSYYLERVREGV